MSIKLESDTLMYYVNFFCVYLCFVYCFTVRHSSVKIIVAVLVTLVGLVGNIVYWIVLNKGEEKFNRLMDEGDGAKRESMLRRQNSLRIA